MRTVDILRAELRKKASRKKAGRMSRFFKTGPGGYAEKDIFLGVSVPDIRETARGAGDLTLREMETLLRSPAHEERFLALVLMINAYRAGAPEKKERIYRAYLENTGYVNNWDLVDLSAPAIAGQHLLKGPITELFDLAGSSVMWERRIAAVSTLRFIRNGSCDRAIRVLDLLIEDEEDLLHKACGWMLREIGKRDMEKEKKYLMNNRGRMSRTTLRYAIERFPENERKAFLSGKAVRGAKSAGEKC